MNYFPSSLESGTNDEEEEQLITNNNKDVYFLLLNYLYLLYAKDIDNSKKSQTSTGNNDTYRYKCQKNKTNWMRTKRIFKRYLFINSKQSNNCYIMYRMLKLLQNNNLKISESLNNLKSQMTPESEFRHKLRFLYNTKGQEINKLIDFIFLNTNNDLFSFDFRIFFKQTKSLYNILIKKKQNDDFKYDTYIDTIINLIKNSNEYKDYSYNIEKKEKEFFTTLRQNEENNFESKFKIGELNEENETLKKLNKELQKKNEEFIKLISNYKKLILKYKPIVEQVNLIEKNKTELDQQKINYDILINEYITKIKNDEETCNERLERLEKNYNEQLEYLRLQLHEKDDLHNSEIKSLNTEKEKLEQKIKDMTKENEKNKTFLKKEPNPFYSSAFDTLY